MAKWSRKRKTPQELRDPPAAFSCVLYSMGHIVELPAQDGRTLETDQLHVELSTRSGGRLGIHMSVELSGKDKKPVLKAWIETGPVYGDRISLYEGPMPITKDRIMNAFAEMVAHTLEGTW